MPDGGDIFLLVQDLPEVGSGKALPLLRPEDAKEKKRRCRLACSAIRRFTIPAAPVTSEITSRCTRTADCHPRSMGYNKKPQFQLAREDRVYRDTAMFRSLLLRLLTLIVLLQQAGCAALLPSGKATVEAPWLKYSDVKNAFESITIGVSTAEDLKEHGFDIKSSPNLKVLNYLDIAANVQAIPIEELDPGLLACLRAKADCRAYVFEPEKIYTNRVGNFWLDIMNFRRKTHQTGWRFKALVVLVDHHVAYKLSSGEPQIDQLQDQINPLGPFQFPANELNRLLRF